MMLRLSTLTVLSLSLLACSTTPRLPAKAHLAMLQQRLKVTTQAQAWTQLAAQPLPAKPQVFEINDTLPVTKVDQNNGYALKFVLPAFQTPYSIVLQGFSNVQTSDGNILMFAPVVYLLDEQHQITRQFSAKDLVRRGAFNLERTIFMNPKNAQERYLVISGDLDGESFDRKVASSNQGAVYVAGAGSISWATGSESKNTIFYSPVGSVLIKVNH
jgi:hypothetical protein